MIAPTLKWAVTFVPVTSAPEIQPGHAVGEIGQLTGVGAAGSAFSEAIWADLKGDGSLAPGSRTITEEMIRGPIDEPEWEQNGE